MSNLAANKKIMGLKVALMGRTSILAKDSIVRFRPAMTKLTINILLELAKLELRHTEQQMAQKLISTAIKKKLQLKRQNLKLLKKLESRKKRTKLQP